MWLLSPVLPSETDEGVTAGERRRAAPTLAEVVWEETPACGEKRGNRV